MGSLQEKPIDLEDAWDLHQRMGIQLVSSNRTNLNTPIATDGLKPTAEFYDFNKDDHYLSALFIRNAKSLVGWLKDVGEVTDDQEVNLYKMLDGQDQESIRLAIMLIEAKQKIVLEKTGIRV